jgi:hypothetical protein
MAKAVGSSDGAAVCRQLCSPATITAVRFTAVYYAVVGDSRTLGMRFFCFVF